MVVSENGKGLNTSAVGCNGPVMTACLPSRAGMEDSEISRDVILRRLVMRPREENEKSGCCGRSLLCD